MISASRGLEVRGVVITRYEDQPAAETFANKLDRRGITVYIHRPIPGYPADVARIVSDEGFGANPYIETDAPLVVVNAPGPNSGKMGTCLSQVYHEHLRGVRAGYAKFETFPIWNLPLRHPVNAAYEAATAELRDVNMIDPFHLEAYDERAVNYNRDVEAFPLLRRILEKITGESMYQSPTDMGVNRAGFAIIDDAAAQEAGKREIIRRFFRYACDEALGLEDGDAVRRIEALMEEFDLKPEHRWSVVPARSAAEAAEEEADKGHRGVFSGGAVELPTREIVTGHNSPLMHASSALVLNAIKVMAGIPKHLDLDQPGGHRVHRHPAQGPPRTGFHQPQSRRDPDRAEHQFDDQPNGPARHGTAAQAVRVRTPLDSPAHTRRRTGLRRLGVNLTCDPKFATNKLFMS